MRRTLNEILVFIVVSAIITVGTAMLGAKLLAPPPTTADEAMGSSCIDEPFVPSRGSGVRAGAGTLARLCFTVHDVRPRLELTGLTSGTVVSAWLTSEEHPTTEQREPCDVPPPPPGGARARPARIAATVADQTGRALLAAILKDQHVVGGSRLQIVAVDHGWAGPGRAATNPDELVDWESGWGPGLAARTGDNRHRGGVMGCASFWLRGGVDSLGQ